MSTRKQGARYPVELRRRAVRMVLDHQGEYPSQWKAIFAIAEQLGVHKESLRVWVRTAETDAGTRPGATSEERERIKQLERENRELRRANDLEGTIDFLRDRARRSNPQVVAFIDANRHRWGVEPICDALQFAPSMYYAAKSRSLSARAQRDEVLKPLVVTMTYVDWSTTGASTARSKTAPATRPRQRTKPRTTVTQHRPASRLVNNPSLHQTRGDSERPSTIHRASCVHCGQLMPGRWVGSGPTGRECRSSRYTPARTG